MQKIGVVWTYLFLALVILTPSLSHSEELSNGDYVGVQLNVNSQLEFYQEDENTPSSLNFLAGESFSISLDGQPNPSLDFSVIREAIDQYVINISEYDSNTYQLKLYKYDQNNQVIANYTLNPDHSVIQMTSNQVKVFKNLEDNSVEEFGLEIGQEIAFSQSNNHLLIQTMSINPIEAEVENEAQQDNPENIFLTQTSSGLLIVPNQAVASFTESNGVPGFIGDLKSGGQLSLALDPKNQQVPLKALNFRVERKIINQKIFFEVTVDSFDDTLYWLLLEWKPNNGEAATLKFLHPTERSILLGSIAEAFYLIEQGGNGSKGRIHDVNQPGSIKNVDQFKSNFEINVASSATIPNFLNQNALIELGVVENAQLAFMSESDGELSIELGIEQTGTWNINRVNQNESNVSFINFEITRLNETEYLFNPTSLSEINEEMTIEVDSLYGGLQSSHSILATSPKTLITTQELRVIDKTNGDQHEINIGETKVFSIPTNTLAFEVISIGENQDPTDEENREEQEEGNEDQEETPLEENEDTSAINHYYNYPETEKVPFISCSFKSSTGSSWPSLMLLFALAMLGSLRSLSRKDKSVS